MLWPPKELADCGRPARSAQSTCEGQAGRRSVGATSRRRFQRIGSACCPGPPGPSGALAAPCGGRSGRWPGSEGGQRAAVGTVRGCSRRAPATATVSTSAGQRDRGDAGVGRPVRRPVDRPPARRYRANRWAPSIRTPARAQRAGSVRSTGSSRVARRTEHHRRDRQAALVQQVGGDQLSPTAPARPRNGCAGTRLGQCADRVRQIHPIVAGDDRFRHAAGTRSAAVRVVMTIGGVSVSVNNGRSGSKAAAGDHRDRRRRRPAAPSAGGGPAGRASRRTPPYCSARTVPEPTRMTSARSRSTANRCWSAALPRPAGAAVEGACRRPGWRSCWRGPAAGDGPAGSGQA